MEKSESFQYRIAARTEAAGKYDPSAPREGNEDSFCIVSDAGNSDASVVFDTLTNLPEKGTLLVVADGMGGHNAGEVASQIAVDTVREMFATGKITDNEFLKKESRAQYLESVVVEADKKIRAEADSNPDRKGMGSTIIMAWIVGNELTVTWCGDSRAYRYHSGKGLEMLSEDHSMVQDLVRKKQLKYEETFSHPQGNIITHCLGGGGKGNAQPESRQFTVSDGDIIMLCSDGLSGVLFDDNRTKPNSDEPYSTENIQDILSRGRESLKDTLSCLFDAARRCDWYDNVTAIVLEIIKKREDPSSKDDSGLSNKEERPKEVEENKDGHGKRCRKIWYFLVPIIIAIISIFIGRLTKGELNGKETVLDSTIESEDASFGRESMIPDDNTTETTSESTSSQNNKKKTTNKGETASSETENVPADKTETAKDSTLTVTT